MANIEVDPNFDIERQVHRENEGQDTITPLTNTPFLKQLNKLKHVAGSNKSINSTNSSNADRIDIAEPDTQSVKSNLSQRLMKKASLVPESFRTLFRTKSDNRAKNESNLIELLDQSFFETKSNLDTSSNVNEKSSTLHVNRVGSREEASSSSKSLGFTPTNLNTNSASQKASFLNLNLITASNSNSTDKVFDAISSIIQNQHISLDLQSKKKNANFVENLESREKLIENVRLIVKQSEMLKKHRINKSIFMCRFFTFMVFLLMFIFVLYFIKTILSITDRFLTVDEESVNYSTLFGYARYNTSNQYSNVTSQHANNATRNATIYFHRKL